MRYTPDNEFRLFRLDVDHIILVIKLAQLTQELLELLTPILTHFALKVIKRFIYRPGRSERMFNAEQCLAAWVFLLIETLVGRCLSELAKRLGRYGSLIFFWVQRSLGVNFSPFSH
jgi:hypothetical protein